MSFKLYKAPDETIMQYAIRYVRNAILQIKKEGAGL